MQKRSHRYDAFICCRHPICHRGAAKAAHQHLSVSCMAMTPYLQIPLIDSCVKEPPSYGKETSITHGNCSKPLLGVPKKNLIKNLRNFETPINRLIRQQIRPKIQRKYSIRTDKHWGNVRAFSVYYSSL